jgi:hypothetical protein
MSEDDYELVFCIYDYMILPINYELFLNIMNSNNIYNIINIIIFIYKNTYLKFSFTM